MRSPAGKAGVWPPGVMRHGAGGRLLLLLLWLFCFACGWHRPLVARELISIRIRTVGFRIPLLNKSRAAARFPYFRFPYPNPPVSTQVYLRCWGGLVSGGSAAAAAG